LKRLGLVPGAEVRVKAYSAPDQKITLQVEGRKRAIVLDPAVSNCISIEVNELPYPT
jgi:Fe2+ transport system protein FeoA